ncbi:MAG: PEP-CTERM sorting domain-containing protein [Terracidiphilus sp.]|jgi:hypothetical protein
MRRITVELLVLALAITVAPAAMADTFTVGPLTFGDNSSFGSGGTSYYPEYDLVQLSLAGGGFNTVGTTGSGLYTSTFTFNIAAGWGISNIVLHGGMDDGDNVGLLPWGDVWEQQITLCSAADVCTTSEQTGGNGPLRSTLPTLALETNPGAGTGTYQFYYYSVNNEGEWDGGSPDDNANIWLEPTPEPSSWLLLGTGLLALTLLAIRQSPKSNCRNFKPAL